MHCYDQAVSSAVEEVSSVDVGPILGTSSGFAHSMVVNLTVCLGWVVRFQSQTHRAGGKEERLWWSLRPAKTEVASMSRLIDGCPGVNEHIPKTFVASIPDFEGLVAKRKMSVSCLVNIELIHNRLQVVEVSQAVWAYEPPLGRTDSLHSILKRPQRLLASYHPK